MPKPYTDISDDLVLAKARHLRDRISKLLDQAEVPGMRESAVSLLRTVVVPEKRAVYERTLATQTEWIANLQERTLFRAVFREELAVLQGFRRHLKKHFKPEEITAPEFKAKMTEYLDAHPEVLRLGKRYLSLGWTWKSAMKLRETEPREWLLDATATELSISTQTLEKVLTERLLKRKLHPSRRYKSLRRSRLPDSPQ